MGLSRYHFTPEDYFPADEIPGYEELQDEVARETKGTRARRILELGTGTGETAGRLLALHPDAHLVGIDSSAEMLTRAREALPDAELLVRRLEDPLPEGPFDLVVSALAVHHLDSAGKADLFRRVADVLRPGGRFVLADVVVPERPEDAVIPCTPGFDLPDPVPDQLQWLREAGLRPRVTWARRDRAVLVGER